MRSRSLFYSVSIASLSFVLANGSPALAQDATEADTTQPPAASEPEQPTAEPTPDSANQASEPANGADEVGPADDSQQLPEVEVIQQQPEPEAEPQPAPQQTAQPESATPPVEQYSAPPPQVAQPEQLPEFAAPGTVAPALTTDQQRAAGDIVRMSPYGGSEIPIENVAGTVNAVSAAEISEAGSNDAKDILQKQVPGVTIVDGGGSGARAQIDYRGFGVGALNGFPQSLAVYQNGIRINEVFGDTVNFDLIPKNAISDITIQTGNPIFGLNAVGGSMNIVMKDGFNYQSAELKITGGSYGHYSVAGQAGIQSGPFAVYFAGEYIEEDGWRDFSPTDIKRGYFDIGAKGSRVEAHVNLTIADSLVGAVAATPVELLAIARSRTFTSPQTTDLNVVMPSFNFSVKATDTLTITGLAYYRNLKSRVIDGNVLEAEECSEVIAENPGADASEVDDPENLCSEEVEDDENEIQPLFDQFGNQINPDDRGLDEPFGVIDRINTDAESFGFGLQATDKRKILDHKNHFVIGTSYDQGSVRYKTSSELGEIGPFFVVDGSGIIISEPDDFAARDVDVVTNYFGIYFLDNIELTEKLSFTFGGRYNYAKVDLEDLSGEFPGITSNHKFERFNPNVGATYQMLPGVTLYGGYSEANRAPTPGELACADPENPCPIESFLTDDPPLDQVISRTFEVGLRGKMKSWGGDQRLDWGLNLFRTENQDDILFVASSTTGRGYFLNAGDTLRRGLEASLRYKWGPLSVYASYGYVKATFETANEFSSPANPEAEACSANVDEDACINVEAGDNIPNIPNHRFRTGFDYWVTSRWKVGADLIASSGRYYLGDEANLLGKLGGYTRVDVSTSYNLTDNIQIFAFGNNIFDKEYGLFGTLFEADEAPGEVVAPGFEFENPRSVVPGAPVAVYGGIKIKY